MSDTQWHNGGVAENWGLFPPPVRPSISELVHFEQILLDRVHQGSPIRVGILGSTPEYRDLCQIYGVEYRCIESTPDNFEVLGRFMHHKDSPDHILPGDWRTMDFPDQFDLFFGDLVTTVVPAAERLAVLTQIRAHSNPEAQAVLKVPLRPNDSVLTHAQIVKTYREKYAHYLELWQAMWHEIVLADYDFKHDVFRCPVSLAAWRQSLEQGIVTEEEFLSIEQRWSVLGEFSMNIPNREKYLSDLESMFDVAELTGTDWYKAWAPVIVLKRKV